MRSDISEFHPPTVTEVMLDTEIPRFGVRRMSIWRGAGKRSQVDHAVSGRATEGGTSLTALVDEHGPDAWIIHIEGSAGARARRTTYDIAQPGKVRDLRYERRGDGRGRRLVRQRVLQLEGRRGGARVNQLNEERGGQRALQQVLVREALIVNPEARPHDQFLLSGHIPSEPETRPE